MNNYLKVVNDRLDRWFMALRDEKHKPNEIFPKPTGEGYIGRYESISKELCPIHAEVEKGAIVECIKRYNDGTLTYDEIVYLNNHGLDHVNHVIDKATEILENLKCKLSPYEGYLLLTAIQFHDVGNFYGRGNHEKNCRKIMSTLGTVVGTDSPEKESIIDIAAAHSGNIAGDKDKIGGLEPKSNLMGQPVRECFIAAVLRFADELADDRRRASRFVVESEELPEESKIFHAYSLSLHSVVLEDSAVNLSYALDHKTVQNKYTKNGGTVFLLDEIRARILKMHLERVYCMRFFEPGKRIERIRVKIDIYPDFDRNFVLDEEKKIKITGTVEEAGYPEGPSNGLDGVCSDDLKDKTGEWLEKQLAS